MSSTLDEFIAENDWGLLERLNGWTMTRDTDNADIVRLTVPARDGEIYIARCECGGYPKETPSVVFVSQSGSKDDPTAWPAGDAEFDQIIKPPPNCFLCTSLTREGLQHHPNWKNEAASNSWNGNKHTLLDIFNLLARLLGGPHYTARRKG